MSASWKRTNEPAKTPSLDNLHAGAHRNGQRHWTTPTSRLWLPSLHAPDSTLHNARLSTDATHLMDRNRTFPARRARWNDEQRSNKQHIGRECPSAPAPWHPLSLGSR